MRHPQVEARRVAPTRLNRGAAHLIYVTVIDGLGFKRDFVIHPNEQVEIVDQDAEQRAAALAPILAELAG